MNKLFIIAASLCIVSTAHAQDSSRSTTHSTTSTPVSPVSGMRNKISAGDLLSAESILEVYRLDMGEDTTWLLGLAWLARGALLVGDTAKASRYASDVLLHCRERFSRGWIMDSIYELEYAYGTAIEVQAQLLERQKGVREAVNFLQRELATLSGPVALISRLNKRINMATLVGERAPEIEVEDYVGSHPPSLASLRGKPVLIFIWAYGCGDCKGQAASLAKMKSRFESRGLQLYTLTRYYSNQLTHAQEKAKIDSVWKSPIYAGMGTVPMAISTASAERYGGSSTPTFVFVDRDGYVRRYTPTRLTEEELSRTIELLVR